jgi:outer membrane lipoprotein-sorting protein
LALLLFLLAEGSCGHTASLGPEIASWLEAQSSVKTWAADFVQTRYLKTLTQPLKATGKVWFAAPGYFRWELGAPPQSVAIRGTNEVLLIYPALKRAEKYSLNEKGPWKDALSLLEAGFPKSRADLEARFEVVSQKEGQAELELSLRPKSPSARSIMPLIRITIDPASRQVVATELTFKDASRMRNDFSNQQLNPDLPKESFSTAAPDGYEVVEPGRAAK